MNLSGALQRDELIFNIIINMRIDKKSRILGDDVFCGVLQYSSASPIVTANRLLPKLAQPQTQDQFNPSFHLVR